jgi:hypothetical protein
MADQQMQEEKKAGAKQYSLVAQIFSGLWIAVHTILKGIYYSGICLEGPKKITKILSG